MKIDLIGIEKRIVNGEKLSRKESKEIMRYLNGIHLNRMDYPVDIDLGQIAVFEAQARTRAFVRLNTDYSK